jgi:hypothetical protein
MSANVDEYNGNYERDVILEKITQVLQSLPGLALNSRSRTDPPSPPSSPPPSTPELSANNDRQFTAFLKKMVYAVQTSNKFLKIFSTLDVDYKSDLMDIEKEVEELKDFAIDILKRLSAHVYSCQKLISTIRKKQDSNELPIAEPQRHAEFIQQLFTENSIDVDGFFHEVSFGLPEKQNLNNLPVLVGKLETKARHCLECIRLLSTKMKGDSNRLRAQQCCEGLAVVILVYLITASLASPFLLEPNADSSVSLAKITGFIVVSTKLVHDIMQQSAQISKMTVFNEVVEELRGHTPKVERQVKSITKFYYGTLTLQMCQLYSVLQNNSMGVIDLSQIQHIISGFSQDLLSATSAISIVHE